MAILTAYQEFTGGHYETGTVRNILAYQGVKAPHTGEPMTEALLMGIAGGAAFGYFTFEYKGYPPHIVLLTRNTFDPLETLFERLALPREVVQTTNSDKGEANLIDALESGKPAIVWADMFSLPYNLLPFDENNWGVRPLLVYGYEDGQAYLVDRANCPIIIPADVLHQARARIANDKFRVMTLDAPDMDRLAAAVSKGIWQSISLYTDAPPKGKRDNFGLAALQYWAKMLTNTRNKHSWSRFFPVGERLWMALAGNTTQPGTYSWIRQGAGNQAERGLYADFLDEAAVILSKSAIKEAAVLFRKAESAWDQLADSLLPDDVSQFKDAKTILDQKQALFMEKGAEATDEIQQLNARFTEIQTKVTANFPMSDKQVSTFQEKLAEQVLAVHHIEKQAIECLQSVMA